MKKVILSLVIFLSALFPLGAIDQTVISDHNHSPFSDGTDQPTILIPIFIKLNYDAFMMTDHKQEIPLSFKGTRTITPFIGYEKYFKTFNIDEGIIGFAGVEVTAGGHLLVFGEEDKMRKFCKNTLSETMSKVVDLVHYYKLISIAAHPSQSQYPFKKASDGISGIEFFNEKDDQYPLTRQWYFDLLKNGRDIFVSGGSDHHSLADPTDLARWKRKTILLCAAKRSDILQAFRSGKTYTTSTNCALANMNYWPKFNWQKTEIAKLTFDIVFSKKTTSDYLINIYSDGKIAKNISLKKGYQRYTINFNDETNYGRHWYVIEMKRGKEFCLITSPIRLDIAKTFVPEPEKQKWPQDLIGKSRIEIGKIVGNKSCWEKPNGEFYLWTELDPKADVTFSYENYPVNNYKTYINFHPSYEVKDFNRVYNNVQSVVVKFMLGEDYLGQAVKPKSIVPAEILKAKPFGVYRSFVDNVIEVVWFGQNRTYLLWLYSSNNRPLYSIVAGKYYKNKNTLDFANSRVYHFAYANKKLKIEKVSETYGRGHYYLFYIDSAHQSVFSGVPFD